MRQLAGVVVALTGVLLFCVCGCSDSPTGPSSDGLLPLKKGNAWVFSVFLQDEGLTIDTTITLTVAGTVTVQGEQYFSLGATSIAQNSSDGLLLGSIDSSRVVRDRFFKYPVTEGESYTYTSIDSTRVLEVAVSKDSITVGAGHFDCLAYSYSDSFAGTPFEYVYYFVPHLGFVYFRARSTTSESVYRLSSYSLK